MTLTEINAKLIELEEQDDKKTILSKKAEKAYSAFLQKKNELHKQNAQIYKEERDVEKLEKFTFISVMASILGTKSEKLSKEQKEVLDASIKRDAIEEELQQLSEDYDTLKKEVDLLPNYNKEIDKTLQLKEQLLLDTIPEFKEQYETLKQNIRNAKKQNVEVEEALRVGTQAASLLRSAMNSLESASKYHKWDTWADTGVFVHMKKHEHLDKANSTISRARQKIKTFNKELEDIKLVERLTSVGHVSVNRTTDYWFDNIFTNMAIRDQLDTGMISVRTASSKVNNAVRKLKELSRQCNKTVQQNSLKLDELIKGY